MITGRHPRRKPRRPLLVAGLIALTVAVAVLRTTDFQAPPRFDGAGYAVLARALATGQGYREIDHPDAPRHAHFPPGYPAALALLEHASGRSIVVMHAFSLACTILATLAAWRWFGGMERPRTAALLGLALAVNWTWNRTGGAIQSEPLFLLLSQLAVLAAARVGRRGGSGFAGVALGVLLGACVLTRHVGVALAVAIGVELLIRRRWRAALAAGSTAVLVVAPWVAWLALVREHTQVGLVGGDRGRLAGLVAGQALFYLQRLPDQVTGPVVEVATVFGRAGWVGAVANVWAVLATGLLVVGWFRCLRDPRRRPCCLVAFGTLGLLLVWPFTEAGRFLIPLAPCLLVGATEGLAVVARRVGVRRRSVRSVAAGLVLAASLPYSVYALATDRAGVQRRTHDGFDAACAWIRREGVEPGPILTRHPGEVFWLTGRRALAVEEPGAVSAAIERYRVAYLLVDQERYANAPRGPLGSFVETNPNRVREVWRIGNGRATVAVYATVTEPPGGVVPQK